MESEVVPMFATKDLDKIDPGYFTIIYRDAYDVTIKSKNTGHYWSLHNPEYPETGQIIIFHSHNADRSGRVLYHMHGRANSLRQAIRSIQSHDRWQMKGRPRRRTH